MPKEPESTLGERMQGTIYEMWANIAQSILDGRRTFDEAQIFWKERKIEVDWEFVKRYIAKHKHEYPDYKE